MKTEILNSELITKEMVVNELTFSGDLSKEEIDEYLDILCAMNCGDSVYNLTTNKGEYLLYIRGGAIRDTKEKYKKI